MVGWIPFSIRWIGFPEQKSEFGGIDDMMKDNTKRKMVLNLKLLVVVAILTVFDFWIITQSFIPLPISLIVFIPTIFAWYYLNNVIRITQRLHQMDLELERDFD